MMEDKTYLVAAISDAIRSGLSPDGPGSLTPTAIDKELTRLDQEFRELLNSVSPEISEWDEELIRQAVETVKVLSDHEILVCLRGGVEIRQEVI